MKNSFFRFVLPCIMMLGVMTGCNENSEQPESLSIKPETIEFEKDAAEKQFVVESNIPWRITCSDTWFTATPIAGSYNRNVKLSVTANRTDTPRTGTLTVKYIAGEIEKTLQVTQRGNDPFIFISEDAIVNSEGGDVTVTVDASSSWTIVMPENTPWLTKKSQNDKEAAFTVGENDKYEPRTAIITFKLDLTGESKTFTLTQLKLGEWVNVTKLVGLKNTQLPFQHEGEVVNNLWGGYYKAQYWTANENAKANGNIELASGKLIIWTYNIGAFTPSPNILNGHFYQTVSLEEGLYRFDTNCTDFFSVTDHWWMYFGAAVGNDLPDITGDPPYNPEVKMLGCVPLSSTGLYSCNFEVPEGGATVSLGFIAHFLSGSLIFAFDKVELWKYE